LGWTVATWIFSVGSVWVGALSVGLALSLPAAAFVTVVISTVQAVPSSPGYVGVYHAAVVGAMAAFGVDPATALGAAVITHAFTYGTLVAIGVIALFAGGYGAGDLIRTSSASPPGLGSDRVAPAPVER
jgi:uncharacterized membrane protein YbhN (UPF0104 family)